MAGNNEETYEVHKEHAHEFLDEPEEHEESAEQVHEEMREGEKNVDVYTEEGREELVEDAEIEEWEDAFSEGAEGRGKEGNCAHCGALLSQKQEEVIERKYNAHIYHFCSDACASKGPKKIE